MAAGTEGRKNPGAKKNCNRAAAQEKSELIETSFLIRANVIRIKKIAIYRSRKWTCSIRTYLTMQASESTYTTAIGKKSPHGAEHEQKEKEREKRTE